METVLALAKSFVLIAAVLTERSVASATMMSSFLRNELLKLFSTSLTVRCILEIVFADLINFRETFEAFVFFFHYTRSCEMALRELLRS